MSTAHSAAMCPLAGHVVAPVNRRGRFADDAWCPGCEQLAPVFHTSEPTSTNTRYARHEIPGGES